MRRVRDVFPPIPTLRGERLNLRALDIDDADALFALHSDPLLMRYWSFVPWVERNQAVDHVERLAREREVIEFYPWVACLHVSDIAVGTCSLFAVQRDHARCVIGYSLAPTLWGRGYAREMLRLALDYAFATLDLNRIEADVDPLNTASCILLERAGFVREGLLRERWRVGGGVQDTALYGLLRSDYRRRPERCL